MAPSDLLASLTPREREVLELLRLGLTDAEVAKRLDISLSGAKFHTSTILRKLDVSSRYEAAYFPEPCPWWVRALAPLFWLRPPGKGALPVKANVLGVVAAAASLVATAGGLGALAVLLLLSSQGGEEATSTAGSGTAVAPTAAVQSTGQTPASVQPTPQGPSAPPVANAALPISVASTPGPVDAPPQQPDAPPTSEPPAALRGLFASGATTCFLTAGSELRCAGDQFGTTPVSFGPARQLDLVTVGSSHACGRVDGGRVQCWGTNAFAQLGNSDAYDTGPSDVEGLAGDVAQLAAGGDRTCALLSNGGVQCWGSNEAGQLGGPSSASCLQVFPCSPAPVSVCADTDCRGLLAGAAGIAMGRHHTCAVVGANREGRCWGNGDFGQLGSGGIVRHPPPPALNEPYFPSSAVPVVVCADASCGGPLQEITEIASGSYEHTCALVGPDGDAGVKCWGRNDHGQLGNGTFNDSYAPVDVVGLTDAVVALSAGGSHLCALTVQGSVMCWGENNKGQLGDGTTSDSSVPVRVRGLGAGVRGVAAGAEHTCAIDAREEVHCWGSNFNGQLSNGTLDDATLPAPVLFEPPPRPPGPVFAIDCDASSAGVQSACSYDINKPVSVQVQAVRIPSRGFDAFQVEVAWTVGIIDYLPIGNPSAMLGTVEDLRDQPTSVAAEALWRDCTVSARAFDAAEGWLAFACVHAPRPIEMSHDSGALLEFTFRCLRRGTARLDLRPSAQEGNGTFFMGPVVTPGRAEQEDFVPADVVGANITCR